MAYSIRPVENAKDLKVFIRLPYRLYRDHPHWVPPLLSEEKKTYSLSSNPMLEHCDYQLFLLLRDNEPVGRISAFIDHLAVEHWEASIGLFGSYECIDDAKGSRMLLDAARAWLAQRGMTRMRGPWSFASQEWGTLIQGFDAPPMVMAPYSPEYHNGHMLAFGLEKVKDLMVYEIEPDASYTLPERFLKITDRIVRRYGVTIRPMDMKNLEADVKIIVDVGNASTDGNWGFVPVTDAEARDIAHSMKPIVDPDLIMIAEAEGRPIGYLIAFPDVNMILKTMKGRLFPFGVFKLLFGMKKIDQYRVWGLGIIPEYQRRAIDTLFYRKLWDALSRKPLRRVEANYVLEDNMVMNNPIFKMGFEVSKIYRVYETAISG